MKCRDMKATVKNVTEGEEPFVVARVSEGMLWYYGRYSNIERAYEVAEEVGGVILKDGEMGFIEEAKIRSIKHYIELTEQSIKEQLGSGITRDFEIIAKSVGYDHIKKVLNE